MKCQGLFSEEKKKKKQEQKTKQKIFHKCGHAER